MPAVIDTIEDFHSKVNNRLDDTLTYKTSEVVAAFVQKHTLGEMREMTKEELVELADYLEVGFEELELQGPFYIDKYLKCECGRNMTFLDFATTVVDGGLHPKKMIANILSGRNGYWVTVAGKEAKRELKCHNCHAKREYMHHSYTNRNYAYA